MQVFVLIAKDGTIAGVYSTKNNLIADLTTTYAATTIKNIETWEIDKGFIDYLKVNKQTIVTIED